MNSMRSTEVQNIRTQNLKTEPVLTSLIFAAGLGITMSLTQLQFLDVQPEIKEVHIEKEVALTESKAEVLEAKDGKILAFDAAQYEAAVEVLETMRLQEEKKQEAEYFAKERMVPNWQDERFQMFLKVVFTEAGICSLDEQEAVALSIWNRAKKDPNSIIEVLCASGQFTSVINGTPCINGVPVKLEEIPDTTKEAVINVINGKKTLVESLLEEEALRQGLDPKVYAEGGPVFFYEPRLITEKAVRDRAKIKCQVKVGYQTFYKVWDR